MLAYKRLVLVLSLLFSTTAYAGTISVSDFSADSSVSHLNSFKNTTVNVINGAISGSNGTGSAINIQAGTVSEADMYADANPRVRDSYLLGVTVDTISGGAASSQGAFVYSGGTPATDVTLTSSVSAIIVFINGYYISKASTAQTYADNTTTYLWITQAGAYVQSTNPNSTISNSALLAKVVTAGTQITAVTDLANRRLPGLIVPSQFRNGMIVSRDTATTITVFPGTVEINNSTVSKSGVTTLTLGTASDWAGGSSLVAANTYGYIGIDSSGNLKLHTAAPTNQNYGLSVTLGKKRYASWSSTTYRILGWFYMNGASQLYTAEVGNIKEGDVSNSVMSSDNSTLVLNSTVYTTVGTEHYYSSGNPLRFYASVSGDVDTGFANGAMTINLDGSDIDCSAGLQGAANDNLTQHTECINTPAQGTHTVLNKARVNQNLLNVRGRKILVTEQ